MLHCSTMGCIKSFRTERYLSAHEKKGDHAYPEKKLSMTDKAVMKFNELIETRESARLAVSEQVEALATRGLGYEHERGWALKSSHTTYGLDKKAKELAEGYFRTQRALTPPRRAYPAVMKKRLEDAKDPSDPSGNRYLLEYAKIPSEKQFKSLFSRLESSRTVGPKKTATQVATQASTQASTPAAKTPKKAKTAATPIKKITRSTPSVRTPTGGNRKRKVVQESSEESSESSEESGVSEESEESEKEVAFKEVAGSGNEVGDEEEEEDVEILREHEDDFLKRIIEEEKEEIYE